MRRRYAVSPVVAALAIALGAPLAAGCGDAGKDEPPARTVSVVDAAADDRVTSAERAVRAAPNDAQALADLVRAHVSLAYVRGDVTHNTIGPRAVAELRKAASAWERYLALDVPKPDTHIATLMARAFSASGLDDPEKAVRALEIAAENVRPRNPNLYAEIAINRYSVRQFGAGDRAAGRALKLTPPNQRANLRTALRQIRSQAKTQG